MSEEFSLFMRETVDRLARIETMLQSMAQTNRAELDAVKAQYDQRIDGLEKDIQEIQDEKRWLWRTVISTAILAVLQFFQGVTGK